MSNITALPVKTKRDSRIELLRLFACFAVLVLHFKPNTFVEGRRLLSRTFITCLCTDAVGIFLLITGFFFLGNQSYGKRITAYTKKILVPTFVYTLFVATGYPIIIGAPVDYSKIAQEFATTVLTWNPIIHNAQHLWYMYLYGMLVVTAPVLKWVKDSLLTTPTRKTVFFIATLTLFVTNDITDNSILKSQMVPATVFIPGCLFIITGSLLYEQRHKLQGRILPAIISLAVFSGITAVRSLYMQNALNADSGATHMYGWYTGAGFICAVTLAVFVLCLKPFASKTVNMLAANTIDIYILHPLVSEIISAMGYRNWVIATFLDGSETIVQFLKFTVIYSLSVFAVCSVMAMVIKGLLTVFKKAK